MRPFERGLRLLLLCVVLAFAHGGSRIVQAQSGVDPQIDFLIPVGHLGGSATIFRLLEDDYACLAIGDDFLILDILDPFHPVQIGKLSFTGMVIDIHIVGSYAYVLADGRIQVVDLSNPYQPRKLHLLPLHDVLDIDGDDDYLYIAGQVIYIYSLANPTEPVWISTYPSRYNLRVVAALPYLFIQTQVQICNTLYCNPYSIVGLILDISQPAIPVFHSAGFSVTALAESQDFFFVLPQALAEIRVIARSDMGTQTTSATIPLPVPGTGLYIQENILFVADGEGGLRIFDITDPLAAVEQSSVMSILDARDVIVRDRAAFVVAGSQGLVALIVRDPASPIPHGGFRTVGAVQHVTIGGNYLYTSSDRLDIVDISNPAHPKPVGEYNRRGFPVVAGEVLYLAAGDDGLASVDISNPAAPFELHLLALSGGAAAVAIDGDYAYVASAGGQLHVVDIAVPQALVLVASVGAQAATDIVVADGFLVLMGRNDLSFFDLTLPESPQLVFQSTMPWEDESGYRCGYEPGIARAIAAEGNRVYVIWDINVVEAKICILNTSGMLVFQKDTQNLWQLSTQIWLPDNRALAVEVSGGIGYILSGESPYSHSYFPQKPLSNMLLQVFDAAHPPYSENLYNYSSTGWIPLGTDWVADLAIQGGQVVMGKYEDGLHILQWAYPQNYFPIIFSQ